MHSMGAPENNRGMNKPKPIDLPDVRLEKRGQPGDGEYLVVTHKKTGMQTLINEDRLNAWLLRQLRQELVSTKESK